MKRVHNSVLPMLGQESRGETKEAGIVLRGELMAGTRGEAMEVVRAGQVLDMT